MPLSESFQGQAGWGFEQPGLVGGAPAYSRGLELDGLKGPFQPKPFYDSVIKDNRLENPVHSQARHLYAMLSCPH